MNTLQKAQRNSNNLSGLNLSEEYVLDKYSMLSNSQSSLHILKNNSDFFQKPYFKHNNVELAVISEKAISE